MSRIEPGLIPVVTDLERGLRELGVRFGLVGALVPELLLAVRPTRKTNDVDVVAVVATISDFEAVKERLGAFGFTRTSAPYQLKHRDGGRVDILPVGGNVAPGGRLNLGDGFDLNMAGFDHVVPNAIEIPIEGGPTIPVAPLPLYVLLKLVAFTDRKASKDLGSVLHCLEHYLEDDDRRYDVDHEGAGIPYDYTCAYMLGVDGRPFLDAALRQTVTAILDRFRLPQVGAIDLRIVHQLAWPVNGETRMPNAPDPNVELLLRPRLSTPPIVRDAAVLPIDRFAPQLLGVHRGPAVALEHVSAALGQHDERTVIAAGRYGIEQPGVFEVPQIAPVRVERTVVAVAEVARRDDAEGADRGHRADLRAAQRDVAVARPDSLTFTAARQLEVAGEHVARVEAFAFARIGQPAAAALVQLATVDVAIT